MKKWLMIFFGKDRAIKRKRSYYISFNSFGGVDSGAGIHWRIFTDSIIDMNTSDGIKEQIDYLAKDVKLPAKNIHILWWRELKN